MAPFSEVGLQVLLGARTEFYSETLLNSSREVHALQLGVYSGVLVLWLRTRGYRHLPTGLTMVLFAFTMGFPDVHDVCHKAAPNCGSLPVQIKPWYFLTGLLGVAIVAPLVVERLRLAWRRVRADSRLASAAGGDRSTRQLASDGSGTRSDASTGAAQTVDDGAGGDR